MRIAKLKTKSIALTLIAAVFALSFLPPGNTRAAALPDNIMGAQWIMNDMGLHAGPNDGIWGPKTARGLCAMRIIMADIYSEFGVDTEISRKPFGEVSYMYKGARYTTSELNFIVAVGNGFASRIDRTEGLEGIERYRLPASDRGMGSTYMYVNETCQVMIYVEDDEYKRVMPISTARISKTTPNGRYLLDNTQPGWHKSNLYGGGSRWHNRPSDTEIFSGGYGNMYNRRKVVGTRAIYVHGSDRVPTYPASAGCIRVTTEDSDWMWHNVGNERDPAIFIDGEYIYGQHNA